MRGACREYERGFGAIINFQGALTRCFCNIAASGESAAWRGGRRMKGGEKNYDAHYAPSSAHTK